jgi:hypothetical protein
VLAQPKPVRGIHRPSPKSSLSGFSSIFEERPSNPMAHDQIFSTVNEIKSLTTEETNPKKTYNTPYKNMKGTTDITRSLDNFS